MHKIAGVIPLRGASEIDRCFDYLCDDFPELQIGDIVTIPFGKGSSGLLGVVFTLRESKPDRTLKSISAVVDSQYRFQKEQLELAAYMKRQFFCTMADSLRCMLPSGLRLRLEEGFLALNEEQVLRRIREARANGSDTVSVSLGSRDLACPVALAQEMEKEGLLRKLLLYRYRTNEKHVTVYRLAPSSADLTALRSQDKTKYQKILSYISQCPQGATFAQLHQALGISRSPVETLLKKGFITEQTRREFRSCYQDEGDQSTSFTLNSEQEAAYQAISRGIQSDRPCAYLLHGVTGSGKTKVLLRAIDTLLQCGKSVIYLVPEISLTSQTYQQLSQRYSHLVTVIHSALSEGERADAWMQIQRGDKRVVLGTRSAVFSPCVNLGAIILDEEHDSSYKSDSAPRYHARDIARFRCSKSNAVMILSSATPDVESYYKAEKGLYQLLQLKQRFQGNALPPVRIEDLRHEIREHPDQLLGNQLKSQIQSNLSRGEQTILFVDRRGYQRFASCVQCGYVPVCPNCSVSLTLHNQRQKKIVCHYCGHTAPAPTECPSCGGKHFLYHGYGSQKVEEQLREEFPDARILRMDADSVKGKMAHDSLLNAFRNREADILLGTQMVAKGHDFPMVTLVGVIMADSTLYMSDYRAYEHSYALLTQVIGRAGRSEKEGRAFIQTLNPYHEILSLCQKQDYESFYQSEIALRKSLLYPPFCNLCVFGFSSPKEEALDDALRDFSIALEQVLKTDDTLKLIVYGPFEAPIYKLQNVYRKRFIIKYKPGQDVLNYFHRLYDEFSAKYRGKATVHVDINPALV